MNRVWLEDQSRLENEEEYRRRVDADYRRRLGRALARL
jgi:hypothetical protein